MAKDNGAVGAAGAEPVKDPMTVERAASLLEKIGIVLKSGTGPHFAVKLSDPKVMDKGKQKGSTFQRLADVVLTLKSGLPFTGCGLSMIRSPKGEVQFVFMWPSTGSGVWSRGVVDTKGNGTRENPQYPQEAKMIEEIGAFYADLGRRHLIAENSAGRGIGHLKNKTVVREGAITATADDLTAMGLAD